MRQAIVLPIPRKKDNPTEGTNVEAPATRTVRSDSHKRIFYVCDGIETSNYVWSDWIYFVAY